MNKELTPQQQAVLDFNAGVDVEDDELHSYTCTAKPYVDKVITYKPMIPGMSLIIDEVVLNNALTEAGYDANSNDLAYRQEAANSLPKLDETKRAIARAQSIVVACAEFPKFTHKTKQQLDFAHRLGSGSPDAVPDEQPIETLSMIDLMALNREIREVSGIQKAEDEFRKSLEESVLETDETEPPAPADD